MDKGYLKILFHFLMLMIILLIFSGPSKAQQTAADIQMPGPLCRKIPAGVLVDNFEYSTRPQEMGWIRHKPLYTGWPPNFDYAQMQTKFDYEEGDRVLYFYRPWSAFLISTPYDTITTTNKKQCLFIDDPNDPEAEPMAIPGQNSILSFKVRPSAEIESFNNFSFSVMVKGDLDGYAKIILIPKDKSEGEYIDEPLNTVEENVEALCVNGDNPTEIKVYIGEQYTDPTWHLVEMDLNEVIKKYSVSNEEIGKIFFISLTGHKYRLDDIMFKKRELLSFYQDADGDGYGDQNVLSVGSDRPDGFVDNRRDCNDHDTNINPDMDEICDGADNNCDGEIDNIDETCTVGKGPCERSGHMICMANGSMECDVLPDEPIDEILDGVDNNCNGEIDEGCSPEIICPADIVKTVSASGAVIEVSYKATVIDYVDPDPAVTYDPVPGSSFPVGITAVTVTAANASGNTGYCSFTVTIKVREESGFQINWTDPILLWSSIPYNLNNFNNWNQPFGTLSDYYCYDNMFNYPYYPFYYNKERNNLCIGTTHSSLL